MGKDSLNRWRFVARALTTAGHEFASVITTSRMLVEATLEGFDGQSRDEIRDDLRKLLSTLGRGGQVVDTVRSILARHSTGADDLTIPLSGKVQSVDAEMRFEPLTGKRLYIVEDDIVFRANLANDVEEYGLVIGEAEGVEQAWNEMWDFAPDFVAVDLKLGESNGLEFVRDALHVDPDLKIVVVSACVGLASAVTAMRLGAEWVLAKPFSADSFLTVLSRIEFEPELGEFGQVRGLSLHEVEREVIERALRDNAGNKSRAARQLGIHPRTLRRKVARWSNN